MKLDDTQQEKYEALAEAATIAIEPIVKIADTAVSSNTVSAHDFEHALDQSVLTIMDLVDKAYKAGRTRRAQSREAHHNLEEKMPKFIILVNGEAVEVFEGTESAAESRAYECWLDAVDQDYEAVPYSKAKAEEYGLDGED